MASTNPNKAYTRIRVDERSSAELVEVVKAELDRLIGRKVELRTALAARWAETNEIDPTLREELHGVRARLNNLRYILRMAQGARAEKGWN